jgi:hypothetical protein
MPGEDDSDYAPVSSGIDSASFAAVVIFRDRADRWWRIKPNGKFDDLGRHEEPQDYW